MSTLRNATDAAEGSDNYHDQRGTAGAAHVIEALVAGQAHDRLQTGIVATRQSVTWPSEVTEITVSVYREAATDEFSVLGVVFGAPSDAVADAWLAQTESSNTDYQVAYIRAGETRTFPLTDGITRLDMMRMIGGTSLTVVVEAA